ncbi:MAG: hypothetical protein P8185_12895 [Deltaproteobacteria bacterium]|jgi:hypothetical protein
MAFNTLTNYKMLTLISVALLGFVAGINWAARAESSYQDRAIIAQNETQTATDEKNPPSTESKQPEIKTGEEQESTAAQKRPLKDFKPSEQIEADQAVDFPYDI